MSTIKIANAADLSDQLGGLLDECFPLAVILQGPSGAGKSTIVKHIVSAFQVGGHWVERCSTDDAFTRPDGSYAFDLAKLGEAHGKCRNAWRNFISDGASIIILDNTNTSPEEHAWYAMEAFDQGYMVVYVRVLADVETCLARNAGRAPERAVRFQAEGCKRPLPPFPPFDQVFEIGSLERVTPEGTSASEWRAGNGPAPKGFGVRCTGCSLCKAEGHVPFQTSSEVKP